MWVFGPWPGAAQSSGGGAVTGTSAITLPSVTTDATGAVGAVGTAAITLPSITVAGTGKEGFTATAATTLPSITTDGTGKAGASGTSAVTLSPITVEAQGKSGFTGTAEITLSPVTVSGEGAEGFSGTGAVTLPRVTASGTYAEDNAVTGESDISLPSIVVTATGQVVSTAQTAPSYGGTDWERKWKRLADLERAKTSIEAIPADEPEIAEQTLEKIEDDTGIPMPIVVHLDTRSVRAALAEAEKRLNEIIVQERRRRNNNWLMIQ